MRIEAEKASAFRALHTHDRAFILPNPWDIGTARLLAHLGFPALATTSAGCAFALGQRDNTLTRDQVLEHVIDIVTATPLPVSADLENGFGDHPEVVSETIRLAGQAGLAGGSIEDAYVGGRERVYDIGLARERVQAAAEAAQALGTGFVLTARAENFLVGRRDLKDTIARLQAYQEAGADVLYAPGINSKETIAEVVRSVDRPVNVLMGVPGLHLNLDELSAVGVKRVSVGSALARASFGAFLRAAHELRDHGTFTFVHDAVSFKDLTDLFNG